MSDATDPAATTRATLTDWPYEGRERVDRLLAVLRDLRPRIAEEFSAALALERAARVNMGVASFYEGRKAALDEDRARREAAQREPFSLGRWADDMRSLPSAPAPSPSPGPLAVHAGEVVQPAVAP